MSVVGCGNCDNPLTFASAQEIILETHEAWKKLVKGESPAGEISLANTTLPGSAGLVGVQDAKYAAIPPNAPQAPAPIDPSVSKSFFISSGSA